MRDKHYDKKIKVVPSRLRQVLEEEFCGNMLLMAYCCGVDKITLKAWLNGKRLPQDLGMMPYIICVSPSWLKGDSDSREMSDASLFSWMGKRYDELYSLYDKEEWLRHELVKVNALQEKRRKQIKEQAYTGQSEDCHAKDEYDVLMEKLKQAANRLGYREQLAMMVFNAVLRFESTNGKLEETPRSLWGGIRGLGKKSVELLYEAFPEK